MPVEFGNGLALIAGPCVIESEEHVHFLANQIRRIAGDFVFKASFDKANRSSIGAYRGPGLQEGLRILGGLRSAGFQILTDIHEPGQADQAAEVVDVVQIPAFLCRQRDLLVAAGRTGKVVNIKKGQFVAPHDMCHAAEKVASTGNDRIVLTERGSSFGYNNLVVDMRGLVIMRKLGYPVVFDATHSVQLPGAAERVREVSRSSSSRWRARRWQRERWMGSLSRYTRTPRERCPMGPMLSGWIAWAQSGSGCSSFDLCMRSGTKGQYTRARLGAGARSF